MGTSPLRFFLDKIYFRLYENVLEIYLKIVYKRILSILYQRYKPP